MVMCRSVYRRSKSVIRFLQSMTSQAQSGRDRCLALPLAGYSEIFTHCGPRGPPNVAHAAMYVRSVTGSRSARTLECRLTACACA